MKSETVPAHYAVIERLAARAKAEIRELAQLARFELGIPLRLYLERARSIGLPTQLQCPECGGPLFAEIGEWESADGKPTECGVVVGCQIDWDLMFEDTLYPHRYWQSDWEHTTGAAVRFVRRRVRIVT